MSAIVVSIVIVSDYGGGEEKGWQDLRATLGALAAQDFDEPVEYLLVETAQFQDSVPDDLTTLLPSLELVFTDSTSSYDLKNDGARVARGEFVGILDGDCVPDRGWIRGMVNALRENPDFAVVSGRTEYEGRTLLERIIGLLTRSYLDRGRQGPTDSIANNNSGFRKAVLEEFPFPDTIGAFGEKLHVEGIRRAGHQLLFVPDMRTTHAYDGWKMESDIRVNSGYATIKVRQVDPRIRFACVLRLGYLSIPFFFIGRTLYGWWNCLRWGRYYGVSWYHQPFALALAVAVHAMEISGMKLALRGGTIESSAYR
jgi:hypothetical protein